MTPKEKAEDLVGKFSKIVVSLTDYDNSINGTNVSNIHLWKERLQFEIIQRAKKAASISVDEIIENRQRIQCDKLYWQQVKQEIEKL